MSEKNLKLIYNNEKKNPYFNFLLYNATRMLFLIRLWLEYKKYGKWKINEP